MKVAVTGVGGGVGQSVMKALSISTLPVEVYPIDVQPFSAGLYRGKQGTVLPPLESGRSNEWARWLGAHGIEALIPGSDHDLVALAAVRDPWLSAGVCRVLVSDLDLVKTCRDKAMTCQRLKAGGFSVPNSAWDLSLEEAASWARKQGYPVVVKPRHGSASRGFHVAKDEEELSFHFRRVSDPLVQEYLETEGDSEEYTCAVFVDRNGRPVGTFMARRDLSGGATYRAEVRRWPEIHELIEAIGAYLRPTGPLNVQLRRTGRGLIPFELNIRCSGTSAVRAHFGFNEPEMLLRHYVLGEDLTCPSTRAGYVLRYWNEVFLDGAGRDHLQEGRGDRKGLIRAWP